MAEKGLPLTLFTTEDGKTQLRLRLQDDTLWLTQRQIAELYEKSPKPLVSTCQTSMKIMN